MELPPLLVVEHQELVVVPDASERGSDGVRRGLHDRGSGHHNPEEYVGPTVSHDELQFLGGIVVLEDGSGKGSEARGIDG